MSQQNKLMGTPSSSEPPVKRKRGRPRKDENFGKKENAHLPVTPASDGIQKSQQDKVNQINVIDDNMVGREVYGVIECSFDAGYLLSVRIGNSSTLLRGVVFQPGQVSPITPANDVAPQARLYQRRDIPIPIIPSQTQVNGSILQPAQNIEQPVVPFAANTQSASVVEPVTNNVEPFLAGNVTPQQNPEFGFLSQSASVIVPLIDMSKNDAGTSLGGGKVIQQQIRELTFENQSSSSILPLPDMPKTVSSAPLEVGKITMQETRGFGCGNQSSNPLNLKMVEQDEMMQVFEVPASKPMVDIFPGHKIGESQFLLEETQSAETGKVQNELKSSKFELHHTPFVTESQSVAEFHYVDSGLINPSEAVNNKPANSNLDLNPTPQVAEPQSVTPEPISAPMDVVVENPIPPEDDGSRDMQVEPEDKDFGEDETPHKGSPVNDSPQDFGKDENSHNGSPVNDVADGTEEGSKPARTEEAIPSKTTEGFCSGPTTDMDFVLGDDAIPPTESHCYADNVSETAGR